VEIMTTATPTHTPLASFQFAVAVTPGAPTVGEWSIVASTLTPSGRTRPVGVVEHDGKLTDAIGLAEQLGAAWLHQMTWLGGTKTMEDVVGSTESLVVTVTDFDYGQAAILRNTEVAQ
jgi:hypothetical protein